MNHIASVDLGSNYFLQATGNLAILAKYSFSANALTLTSVTVLTYPGHVIYRHVGALTLFNGLISLYGVQIDNLVHCNLMRNYCILTPNRMYH